MKNIETAKTDRRALYETLEELQLNVVTGKQSAPVIALIPFIRNCEGYKALLMYIKPTWYNIDTCIALTRFLALDREIQRATLLIVVKQAVLAYINTIPTALNLPNRRISAGMCHYIDEACYVNGLNFGIFGLLVPVFNKELAKIIPTTYKEQKTSEWYWWPINDTRARILAFEYLKNYIIKQYENS